MPTIVVLGARNLGGAIIEHHLAAGWRGGAVARSDGTLERVRAGAWRRAPLPRRDERGDRVRAPGGLPRQADAADPAALGGALERARAAFGSIDLIVNAVSAARPPGGGPFGGGPFAEATVEGFRGWTGAVAEQAFVFLSEGVKALEGSGCLIQITGGSARRAIGGRGLWAAGAAATRALTHAAALELREQ